ncbi:MAG: replication-associated recombination protein A [Acidobacteria bacterium]|nr:replication-associated recombination protein A [Acidobacteriota bacterium]
MARQNRDQLEQAGNLFDDLRDAALDETASAADFRLQPLAERMRPRSLDEFIGQQKIVGAGRALRRMIEEDHLQSLILWGPPGSGKTTLARIIAATTAARFIPFSGVTSGIKEVREVMTQADAYRRKANRRTVLFVDEIHRFNKAQQDAFLPYVESGTIILIGATTENPSFEVNSALLSRSKVFVLEALTADDLVTMMKGALVDAERGFDFPVQVSGELLQAIAIYASGDARVAWNTLELAVSIAAADDTGARVISAATLREALQRAALRYDKAGEEHFNIISAFIKSIRNSDPDAAIYWLARMIEGGEDPMFIARRIVIHASEDIGMADPQALIHAVAAMQAVHLVGLPEARLTLAQATIYLATAPKSNAVLTAINEALADVRSLEQYPVPMQLRNAPTGLMKGLGYGKNYQYAHDYAEGRAEAMECLPEELRGRQYYKPPKRS